MNKDTETIFIEQEMGFDDWAWHCEKCGEDWVLECGTPEDNNYKYCPNCGREIIQYLKYVEEPMEEED